MISWSAFKTTVDNNLSTIYYIIENHYNSSDPNVTNIDRYFLNTSVSAITYDTCIIIETPASVDQLDFEDNYLPNAILI